MKIKLISVGAIQQKPILELCVAFEKRLSHYIPFEAEVLSPEKSTGSADAAMMARKEGGRILKKTSADSYVILLDERGKSLTSVQFSGLLQQQMNSGRKQLVFIIGGAFGVSEEIRKRADYVLNLSTMTFTHEMARLFFTEQLYRAFTILRNEKYHH